MLELNDAVLEAVTGGHGGGMTKLEISKITLKNFSVNNGSTVEIEINF